METFDESTFREKVQRALQTVRKVLDNTKSFQLPAECSHQYEDKYLLAENVTNAALAAVLNVLELLGLSVDHLDKVKSWSAERSVTLRLRLEEQCAFDRKETKEVESPRKVVTEKKRMGIMKSTTTHKIVTTVTEHFWKFSVDYELLVFRGNQASGTSALPLQQRRAKIEIKTTTETAPRPKVSVHPPFDVNLTWLLAQLSQERLVCFRISREDNTCHTPRRNKEIDGAFTFLRAFYAWCTQCYSYFRSELFPLEQAHNLDLASIDTAEVFVPVLPLFNEQGTPCADHGTAVVEAPAEATLFALKEVSSQGSGRLPSLEDVNKLLEEQKRSLLHKLSLLEKTFPDGPDRLITVAEARLLVLLLHVKQISQQFSDGIDYVEDMLRQQLIAAIGKVVTPADFLSYMRFHNRRLFCPSFQPRGLCYAVRREGHYPEGTFSIEAEHDSSSIGDPIETMVAHSPAKTPMHLPLNASTTVAFMGQRYVHAYVLHQFSGESAAAFSLVARARQFSSFILLVGTIASAALFEPQYGIIIQNKDDLKLPLLLETIPTPKEFQDAIESLSPEQQRFARAFRGMQLASTLFGVCIIQIKPQLEKLLNLPADSLTKEIRLTQDLMELFIKYQVPSDLLSYAGPTEASDSTKLQTVKEYVEAMKNTIQASKEQALEQAKEEQQMRLTEAAFDLQEKSFDRASVRGKGKTKKRALASPLSVSVRADGAFGSQHKAQAKRRCAFTVADPYVVTGHAESKVHCPCTALQSRCP